MPNMTRWLNEPHIMSTTFTGIIDVDEVDDVMHEYLAKLNDDRNLYIMINFSRAVKIPTNLLQMDSIIDILNHNHLQWFVLVNPVGFDSNTTRLLVQDKVKVFNDKDKAVGFLRGMVRLDHGITFE